MWAWIAEHFHIHASHHDVLVSLFVNSVFVLFTDKRRNSLRHSLLNKSKYSTLTLSTKQHFECLLFFKTNTSTSTLPRLLYHDLYMNEFDKQKKTEGKIESMRCKSSSIVCSDLWEEKTHHSKYILQPFCPLLNNKTAQVGSVWRILRR